MPEVRAERWAEIYRDSFPRVYRALVATLFDGEAARDALHDAFVKGLERPPQDTNPEGWLFRVALREARSGPRFRIFRRARERGSEIDLVQLLQRLEAGQLLMLLTERQRAIVVAHYYLGLTQVEIAEQLHIRRGTVGATIAKALAKMRKEALVV